MQPARMYTSYLYMMIRSYRRGRLLFKRGGADTGWPTDTATSSTSCASPTTHGLKAEVTEAWRRRRKKNARIVGTAGQEVLLLPRQRYYRSSNAGSAQLRNTDDAKYAQE